MPSCNTYRLTWVSYLGHGVSLHGCSSKAQLLLLTLDEGYLLTATPPDLERGVAPLGPPAPGSQFSLAINKQANKQKNTHTRSEIFNFVVSVKVLQNFKK